MHVRMASMIRLTVCTPLYVTSYNSILPVIGDGQTYYCPRWLGQLVSETFRSDRSLITTITTNVALAYYYTVIRRSSTEVTYGQLTDDEGSPKVPQLKQKKIPFRVEVQRSHLSD